MPNIVVKALRNLVCVSVGRVDEGKTDALTFIALYRPRLVRWYFRENPSKRAEDTRANSELGVRERHKYGKQRLRGWSLSVKKNSTANHCRNSFREERVHWQKV